MLPQNYSKVNDPISLSKIRAGIKIAVKAKLAKDVRFSTLTNIEVNSTNGIVTLAGQVKSPADRAAAAEVARSVEGVVKVNNELQVEATR